jgi:hypothetical protein
MTHLITKTLEYLKMQMSNYEYIKVSAGPDFFPFTPALFIDCFPNPL